MYSETYLKQYSIIDLKINANIQEILRLKDLMTDISSTGFEMSYNPNVSTDAPYVVLVEDITDKLNELQNENNKLYEKKREIQTAISSLSNIQEVQVLWYTYIQGMSQRDIAEKMIISRSSVYRLKNQGLNHIKVPEK